MLRLLSAGATDVGLLRRNNEDAYLLMPEAGLFALSDGMGGEAAGEVASQYFIAAAQVTFGNQAPASEEASCALIEKAFRCSNKRILEHTAQNPNDSGMGCTGGPSGVLWQELRDRARGRQQSLLTQGQEFAAVNQGSFPGAAVSRSGNADPQAGKKSS